MRLSLHKLSKMDENEVLILRNKIEHLTVDAALKEVIAWYPLQVCFASSLSAEDQAILHMIATQNLPIRVITLDTGRLFEETYDLLEKSRLRYKINIEVISPDYKEVEKLVNEKGINLFYYSVENRRMCCGVRKVEPLKRALDGMKIWITGLRRQQSQTREHAQLLEWDELNGLLKFNPLITWTDEQLWNFIHSHQIPYNPLHDKGYPSIGCEPCTRAIQPGEDVRAGRWWWESQEGRECGIHK